MKHLMLLCLPWLMTVGAYAESQVVISDDPTNTPDRASCLLEVTDAKTGAPLPARVIVTASDGAFQDGSGRGVYADGRFFIDGSCTLTLPAGAARVQIFCGPNYVPLDARCDMRTGRRVVLRAQMHEWFAPEREGWYAGDHHVHAQHDAHAAVRTDLTYTALQARANGLSILTEAGSSASYDNIDQLTTDRFLIRYAPEQRPGPFIGHLCTPGIDKPIAYGAVKKLFAQVMPHHALLDEVNARGGVMIHTHPTTPPHQLHWMGAGILYSDAVLGRTAHALDLDSQATQALWFAALNLGNTIAASGSTDAALGRLKTHSPGDRRVYARADRLDVAGHVAGIRAGHTIATNAGPLFATLTLDGKGPGHTVAHQPRAHDLVIQAHSLNPLTRLAIFRSDRGWIELKPDVAKQHQEIRHALDVPEDRSIWIVLRAEAGSAWSVSSPIHIGDAPSTARGPATALLLQISNATRFAQLSDEFFLHAIATVRPGESLAQVDILRDGQAVHQYKPAEGNVVVGELTPVTGPFGPYAPGRIWFPNTTKPLHLQADWPVTQSGWYALRITTVSGRTHISDAMRFDIDDPNSHQISLAHLDGPETELRLWGYGGEMLRTKITDGDHWWFPQKSFYRMSWRFGEHRDAIGVAEKTALERFRPRP